MPLLFSVLPKVFSLAKFPIIALLLLDLSFLQTSAQSEDYKLQSLDSEFTMEVSRVNFEVKIVAHFRDINQYSSALVEKTDELKNEFRQCAYIDVKEESKRNGVVEKRDKYPRIQTDSYYRLRLVTKEGIERVYPPVRLPAKKI